MKEPLHALHCFPGGLPPWMIYDMSVADIDELVQAHVEDVADGVSLNNTLIEIAYIGVVSYFEAFCAGQFASLINVCPYLLAGFSKKRAEVTVSPEDLMQIVQDHHGLLGYLITDKYDFGTPNKVNGLYADLLGITPFTKDEARRYDKCLANRNLLVHHGGMFTLKHARQIAKLVERGRPFMDSLVLRKSDYVELSTLLAAMVEKITRACYPIVREAVEEHCVDLQQDQYAAITYLEFPEGDQRAVLKRDPKN